MPGSAPARGRPRDASIDAAVLPAARRHLAEHGFEGMSLGAIAREAGTTRQALYRRWPSKRALAESAISAIGEPEARRASANPFSDLVAELQDFRRGVSREGRLSLVGTMLQSATDADVARRYRSEVIAPRRARLRAILERAAADGLTDPAADLEVALTMLTGSWYARCLAGDAEPEQWATRVARLVWRALGGTPPA